MVERVICLKFVLMVICAQKWVKWITGNLSTILGTEGRPIPEHPIPEQLREKVQFRNTFYLKKDLKSHSGTKKSNSGTVFGLKVQFWNKRGLRLKIAKRSGIGLPSVNISLSVIAKNVSWKQFQTCTLQAPNCFKTLNLFRL